MMATTTSSSSSSSDEIISCASNEKKFTISILTDSYPYETSWKLYSLSSSSPNNNSTLIVESSPMTKIFELYTTNICLPSTSNPPCYMFTIYDELNDGFDSGGFYSIKYGNEDLTPSTPFTSHQQQVIFGNNIDDDEGNNSCTSQYTLSPTQSPLPRTYAPTSTPTPCFPNQARIIVTIFTDTYPYETSWKITNMYDVIKAQNEPFYESLYYYKSNVCLWKNQCYAFSIYDTYGDGLNKTEGGYYSVTYDGVELNSTTSTSSNGSWTWNQNLYIGKENGSCDDYTTWPTYSPTTSFYPTFDMYNTNTPTATLRPCDDGHTRLFLTINTDQFPEETSWKLNNTNGLILYEKFIDDYKLPNHRYTESYCLPKNDCYTFTIYDTYGDGLLSFEGYHLQWNDERIQSGSQFWESEQSIFFGGSNDDDDVGGHKCEYCRPGQKLFQLELQTDNYGGETYWDLKKKNKNGNKFIDYIFNGKFFLIVIVIF